MFAKTLSFNYEVPSINIESLRSQAVVYINHISSLFSTLRSEIMYSRLSQNDRKRIKDFIDEIDGHKKKITNPLVSLEDIRNALVCYHKAEAFLAKLKKDYRN